MSIVLVATPLRRCTCEPRVTRACVGRILRPDRINHFLYSLHSIVGAASSIAPDKASLETTNAATGYGSLGQEVGNCRAQYQRPPTFLLVDVSISQIRVYWYQS